MSKTWKNYSGKHYIEDPNVQEFSDLLNAIYLLQKDALGNLFLDKMFDSFDFGYKIYGHNNSLVDRFEKTYHNTNHNLGLLLNGIKGTGKTVTSKLVCNRMQLPVILIDTEFPDSNAFLGKNQARHYSIC